MTAAAANGKHHRRLSSTGKMRRRLSDAREASTRPILVPTPTSSAALSLASLSLSTSPPSGHSYSQSVSQSLGQAGGHIASHSYSQSYSGGGGIPVLAPSSVPNSGAVPIPIVKSGSSNEDRDGGSLVEGTETGSTPITISTSANGKPKKRGVDYKCESCAKVYRHPNCLNKHRWEHTRQWREASKFVLSKHQQVQLLEAATILSYMGTSSTSLPDDRSEWPSFLSGGSLPKADSVAPNANSNSNSNSAATVAPGNGQAQYGAQRTMTYPLQPHLVSSSVPNASSGPRMHDYSLPSAGIPVRVTQVRPGLLGVPTVSATDTNASTISRGNTSIVVGEGGWSLPNSAMRSSSYAGSVMSSRSRSASRSRSRSGSGSRSEESLDIDVDVEGMDDDIEVRVASESGSIKSSYGYIGYGHSAGYGYGHHAGRRSMGMKREEDEMSVGFSVREEDEDEGDDEGHTMTVNGGQDRKWDGMEMEVDMDMD
ncbi:hypothetical protein BDN70DRAFT_185809 [Pholiota conissans]|uniref:C2H2-type domain-containing protein n=1 Tax=Pholiota conissans TaxID=109636 RepID=A0A9P6CQU4_9AGAR|nr:hypothetical protein BDN70DRAFT_185809 [Pholiota conissans]